MLNICIYGENNEVANLLKDTVISYMNCNENKFIKTIEEYNELKRKNISKFDVMLVLIEDSQELEVVKKLFGDIFEKVIILTTNVSSEYIIRCIDVTSNVCFIKVVNKQNKKCIANINRILRKIYLVGGGQAIGEKNSNNNSID